MKLILFALLPLLGTTFAVPAPAPIGETDSLIQARRESIQEKRFWRPFSKLAGRAAVPEADVGSLEGMTTRDLTGLGLFSNPDIWNYLQKLIADAEKDGVKSSTIASVVKFFMGFKYPLTAGDLTKIKSFLDTTFKGFKFSAATKADLDALVAQLHLKVGASVQIKGRNGLEQVHPLEERASPSAPPLPAGMAYKGCYNDYNDKKSRCLPNQKPTSNTQTINACLNSCKASGYAFGGGENGNQCFCGNSIVVNGTSGTKADESKCNLQCSGKDGSICGSSFHISIYSTGVNDIGVGVSISASLGLGANSPTASASGSGSKSASSTPSKSGSSPPSTSKPSGSSSTPKPSGSASTSKPSGSASTSKPSGSASTSKPSGSASASKPSSPSISKPAPSPSASSGPPAADNQEFLELHNNFRSQYGANNVVWNDTLALYAYNAAKTCKYGHTHGPYGENIAAGVGGGYDIDAGFNSWANEASSYNYNLPGFSDATGHFTQLVWKSTTQIGCAAAVCADGTIFTGYGQSSLYIVCEYAPPGNIVSNNPVTTAQIFTANVGQYIDW